MKIDKRLLAAGFVMMMSGADAMWASANAFDVMACVRRCRSEACKEDCEVAQNRRVRNRNDECIEGRGRGCVVKLRPADDDDD